jgi:hypothetical protein
VKILAISGSLRTAMAERVYAAVGFSDLGRILEYVPSPRTSALVRGGAA